MYKTTKHLQVNVRLTYIHIHNATTEKNYLIIEFPTSRLKIFTRNV